MTHKCHDVESFVEQLPVGIIVLDAELQISISNDIALQLLGIDIENCLTGNFLDAVSDAKLKGSLRLVHDGRSQQGHVMIETTDRVVGCTIKTLRGENDCRKIVIVVEDATQVRGLELLKREFIGTLLHKLRGPLATLKTSLALVLYEQVGVLPGDAREIIGMGHHEVNRLSVLLNDMRDLFLIETGLAGKDLDPETFSIADVLDRTVDCLEKTELQSNDIRSRLRFSGKLDLQTTADFEKTKRILMNLLKNALQYSGENKQVELICNNTGDTITIQVRDAGPGFPKDKLPLVFTKFFRADTPRMREIEGNGLGLFIAKSYADLMDGSLYCESEEGRGSSFFLTLPKAMKA